jgi:Dyp-type peroxidase family
MATLQKQLEALLGKPLQDADLQKETPGPLQAVLQNVQGNILHGHGREFATHTFLRFHVGKQEEVKQWLRDHIVCKIISAQDQLDEREAKNRDALFVSCLLSAHGYNYFEWCDPVEKFSAEFTGVDRRDDKKNITGMKGATERLQDPPYRSWEDNYQGEIHAMILLAHCNETTLRTAQENLIDNRIRSLVACHWVEGGNVLPHNRGIDQPREEHFGYVDGHSQPLFFQKDLDQEERERGIDQWDPGVGPHLVLTPDPLRETACEYGSYLVFRKLQQDVDGFKGQITRLAKALGVNVDTAKALVVGRSPNGTPLMPSRDPGANIPNNFNYDQDVAGQLCPYHAHIRRMNPRWDAGGLKYDRRIARRGIPYGRQGSPEPVGLLFMCYQQSLKGQFEALQGVWAHKPDERAFFSKTGNDPLIGALGKETISRHRWPSPTSPKGIEVDISNFVSLRGGEYFFVPSIKVLKKLLGIL